MHTSEQIIEEIIESVVGANTTLQQLHLIREMLRNLVRLARLEYSDEVRRAVIMLQANPYAEFSAEESSNKLMRKLMTDLQVGPGRPS